MTFMDALIVGAVAGITMISLDVIIELFKRAVLITMPDFNPINKFERLAQFLTDLIVNELPQYDPRHDDYADMVKRLMLNALIKFDGKKS